MVRLLTTFRLAAVLALLMGTASPAQAWKNGPPENKVSTNAADCQSPPYATHDWIADQAVNLLPREVRLWLTPFRRLLLIGTEAPDYEKIYGACGTPNRGYNDTGQGRHDLRFDDAGNVTRDIPAIRAEEEYQKAVAALKMGRGDHAAYYLGAAVHYIGDLAQYGHTIKGETHHRDFEAWAARLTPGPTGSLFDRFIYPEGGLVPRRAYDAVIRTGRYTWKGKPPVLPPEEMDRRYGPGSLNDAAFIAGIGHCLNKAANEAANMLYGFYKEVAEPVFSIP